MPSDADKFESGFDRLKEFMDDEGRHYYFIQFEDDSGRVLRKKPSQDENSVAEFVVRDRFAKEGMRKIASATDFDFDAEKNTQQNLRMLMSEE